MSILLGRLKLKANQRMIEYNVLHLNLEIFQNRVLMFAKTSQIQNNTVILLCILYSLCLEIWNCKLISRAYHFDGDYLKQSILNSSKGRTVGGAAEKEEYGHFFSLHILTPRITSVMNHWDLNRVCPNC